MRTDKTSPAGDHYSFLGILSIIRLQYFLFTDFVSVNTFQIGNQRIFFCDGDAKWSHPKQYRLSGEL